MTTVSRGNGIADVSLPVTRPAGRALVVASRERRAAAMAVLTGLGYSCAEADNPYAAMVEINRRPGEYTAVILSLHSIYREELAMIAPAKRRCPQLEVWLADLEGRQSALAEAMRLGADGLLGDEGLHRVGVPTPRAVPRPHATAPTPMPGVSPPVEAVVPAPRPRIATAAGANPGATPATAPAARLRAKGPAIIAAAHSSQTAKPSAGLPVASVPAITEDVTSMDPDDGFSAGADEPVLSADELRALLQEQPTQPPAPSPRA